MCVIHSFTDMKFLKTKTLLAAVSVTALLAGCDDGMIDNTGIDTSLAVPTGFTYDEENSSASTIALYWNPAEAIADGARSFTIQIPQTLNGGDNYDNSVSHTLSADDDNCDMTSFGNLALGSYYARIRANYPKSKFSSWVYLTDSNGEPITIESKLSKPVISSIVAGADVITVSWNAVTDAEGYTVEYKAADATEWTSADAGKVTSYEIMNLEPETAYQVRVQAYNTTKGVSSEYSATGDVTTLEAGKFPMDVNTPERFLRFMNSEALKASETDQVNITADIDLTGYTFTTNVTFKGILNGNNHTIDGFSITEPLFAEIGEAKDLIIGANTSLKTTEPGLIAMLAVKSTRELNNITNKGSVSLDLAADASVVTNIAGIVAEANGDVVGCKNEGAVTLTAASGIGLKGSFISGVVGYAMGEVRDCSNSGAVTLDASHLIDIALKYGHATVTGIPIHMGGVVTDAAQAVSNCSNSGRITYKLTHMENLTKSVGTNCPRIGGVVGITIANVSKCTNTGDIDVLITGSERKAWNGSSYITNNYTTKVGGVVGGQNDNTKETTGDKTASYTDLVNEGNIVFDSDADKSNNTLGGVIGYPNGEVVHSQYATNCINRGTVIAKGAGKFRVGGVSGASGNLFQCKNYGRVENASDTKAGTVGGVMGYSTRKHLVSGCENYGDVVSSSSSKAIVTGGLLAEQNDNINYPVTTGEGCIVKCNVISNNDSNTNVGMIFGKFSYGEGYVSSDGKTKGGAAIVFGSSDNPVKVSGSISVNGTATTITSSNLATYYVGTEAHTPNTQTINAAYGE